MVAFFLIKYVFLFIDSLTYKACCNPLLHENCFIPDFCSNTPCLYNGKCAGTLTLDGHLDFVCICIRGHTGKYCQLVDDFTPIDVEYRPPNAVPNVIG